MDEFAARALMFAVVPLALLMIARGISLLLKRYIPEGRIKDELYRRQ